MSNQFKSNENLTKKTSLNDTAAPSSYGRTLFDGDMTEKLKQIAEEYKDALDKLKAYGD